MKNTDVKRRSLSAKALYSTVINCVIFGLVAQFVALTFYTISLTNSYINTADSIASQTKLSAIHGFDTIGFSKQVMEIYNSLDEDERMLTGTEEYRSYYSDLDMSKGGVYDSIVEMLGGTLENINVYDVYIAMYDRDNNRIVYIADAGDSYGTVLYPGEWEEVNRLGMLRFLEWDGQGTLYDIAWTDNYGLLCTVADPIKDETGQVCSFMLVDISIRDVVIGLIHICLRLFLAMAIVTVLLAWIQARRMTKELVEPINNISKAAISYVADRQNGEMGREHFAELKIDTGDEIEKLSEIMTQMERDLSSYEENLKKITAEKERISTELSLARSIQEAMLPHEFPPFPEHEEFDVYATMEPARAVGGDFYDYFLIDEDHLGLVMADVSDKGIPAALFMMISKTILQSCAMPGKSSAEILKKTNETIISKNQTSMFVTVWFGVLEISSGKLSCANAGHEYPVLKRADGEYEIFKDPHGLVIGGMEDTRYKEYIIELQPKDRLFIYTDGVPEAADANGNMFGIDRMLASLNKSQDITVAETISNVRADISDFVKDAEQFDDLTMLCFEYKGHEA